jgi:hypothetical protein
LFETALRDYTGLLRTRLIEGWAIMISQHFRILTKLAIRLAAAIFFLTVMPNLVPAQSRAPEPPSDRDMMREMRERQQREADLRNLNPTTMRPGTADPKRVEEAFAQIGKDFKQIQILRNALVRNLKAAGPLDYAAIGEEAGEINKRANRLKSFLIARNKEGEEEEPKSVDELNREQMKTTLVTLCKRIESFVDNTVFKLPGTVDAKQSAKAGTDLLSIIELSDSVKKNADRLSKTPGQ